MKFSSLVVERAEARTRLLWIVVFRFGVVAGCLLALGVRRGSASFEPALALGFWVLVGAGVLNLIHALTIRSARHPGLWGLSQVFLDVALISVLIYLSGGVLSYFNVLYFAAILSAGSAVSGRSAVFFASLSTVFLSIVSTLYFLGAYYNMPLPLVPKVWLQQLVSDFHFVISYLLAQGIAFHAVAFLSLLLERRARRSEILQETLLRDISEGVIALDDRNRVLYMNDEARKMLGFPMLVQVAGKHWDQVFRRVTDKPLRDLLFSRQSARRTIELDRGGVKVLLDVKTSLLMDESRRRVIAVLGDLSLHQRAEEAERRADQLEKVAEMAAEMAHELRQPLTAIKSSVELLGGIQPVDDDSRKLVEIVCRESDRLDRIISEFLGFARPRPAKLRRGDVSTVVREVGVLLEQRLTPGVELKMDIVPDLLCLFDAEQLHQALMNLGVNAIEAMEKGGRLHVSAQALGQGRPGSRVGLLPATGDDAGVEICLSDTGPGIAAEDMDRIFTPFFTRKKSGTGLGLAIASRIVKAHGGRIDVDSVPGHGARFVVWLPSVEKSAPSRTVHEDAGNDSGT